MYIRLSASPLQRRLSSSRSASFYVSRHHLRVFPSLRLSASLCVLTGRTHPASLCREKFSACFCVFLLISASLCVSPRLCLCISCAFSAFFCVSLLYISLLYPFSKSLSVSLHICISVRLFVPMCLCAPSTSLCVSLGVTPSPRCLCISLRHLHIWYIVRLLCISRCHLRLSVDTKRRRLSEKSV